MRAERGFTSTLSDAALNCGRRTALAGQTPHDNPKLITVKSYQCALACVMRSDHPLAKKRLIKPADLAGERVIFCPNRRPSA